MVAPNVNKSAAIDANIGQGLGVTKWKRMSLYAIIHFY